MAKSSVQLKLLIDTQSKKVLFAEGNKEAMDFLFYILLLPVATVVKLLREHGMVGSLANIYESLESLNDSYIQPNQSKNNILSPVATFSVPILLLTNQPSDKKLFRCPNHYGYYATDDPRAVCPQCKLKMSTEMTYVSPPPLIETSGVGSGIVSEVVTCMIMDDLVIKPMSSISSITLLNKMNVNDLGVLEEKVVNLGMTEAVKILGFMLTSKTVLTDVFVRGQK